MVSLFGWISLAFSITFFIPYPNCMKHVSIYFYFFDLLMQMIFPLKKCRGYLETQCLVATFEGKWIDQVYLQTTTSFFVL